MPEQPRSERKTQNRVITLFRDELRPVSESCSKTDSRAVDFFRTIFSKDLRQGIITNHGQSPAEPFSEAARFGVAEPVEDAMAKQAAGAE